MDVECRFERQGRQNGGVDIGEVAARMVGQDISTAFGAGLPMAGVGLQVSRNELLALRKCHFVSFPEGKSIDRAGAPGTAILAVAITHGEWLARGSNLDGATETTPRMRGLVRC